MIRRCLMLCLAVIGVACAQGDPETLVRGGYDEQEMSAAIGRARKEVDTFIATLRSGRGSNFAVKIPIEDNGEVEHFWLTGIAYRNGKFEGKIGNDPGIVSNVRFGDAKSVRKEDISDWLFMRDGKMYGNYTLRPLLATMPKEEADYYRSMLAEL